MKSKYNAKKTVIDGITFDSKVEGEYYKNLKDMRDRLHLIQSFKIQPVYELQGRYKDMEGQTIRAITYRADFEITNMFGGLEVIDVKGMATESSKIKRKIFMHKYPTIRLSWVAYVKKHGGWIDFFDLQKLRTKNKKLKKGK